MISSPEKQERLAWYLWPLVPFAILAGSIVMIPLAMLACFSIPFFKLYPDRHRHTYDEKGTPRQQELLARWRASYRPT